MHKFAVFFTACVFVGASADSGAGQEQNQKQAHGHGQTVSAEGRQFSIPVRIVQDPPNEQKTKADAEKSDRDEQRENDNLAIQRSTAQSSEEVAQWAAPMFYASLGALFLSFITVVASSFAAWFALGSVREAREATRIANAALTHTQDSTKKQLRAYLLAKSTVIPDDTPEGMLGLALTVKNCGQTPATITHMGHKAFIASEAYESDFADIELKDYSGIIGGSETFAFHMANQDQIYPSLRKEVAEGMIGVFVRIRLLYKDIFDESHLVQFTRTIEGRRELNGPFGISAKFPDIATSAET